MGILGILVGLLELRNIMIFNLILQTTLTLLSPLRKTASSSVVKLILWAAYTVAGLAADYAVGVATRASLGSSTTKAEGTLIALWASFTYIQVSGPDTITAFSVEDTKSWPRSSFRLMITTCILLRLVIVFFPMNRLAVTVVALSLSGATKYLVRIFSLLEGSLTRLDTFTEPFNIGRDPGPTPLPAAGEARLHAFQFFKDFKRVFANLAFTPQQCIHSCNYFLNTQASDALEIVETELNFVYDVLYTKTLLLLEKGTGPLFRWTALFFELLAFSVWVSADKHKFHKLDVRVTYTLFLSSLVFELVSFFRLLLSDWSIASLLQRATYPEEDGLIHRFKLVYKLISLKNKFPSSRWSKSVPRNSLIMWCTSNYSTKVEKMLDWFKIKDLVYSFNNMSAASFDDKTRDMLFDALTYLATNVDPQQAPRSRSWSRGDWIIKVCYRDDPLLSTFIDSWFKDSMKFEKFVLLWHVATELCYYAYSLHDEDDQEKQVREFTKIVSNYMAHVLVQDDTLLSQVAGEAKVTFNHTCDQVVKLLIDKEASMKGLKDKEEKVEKACKMIVMAESSEEEVDDQLVDGHSVLEDARKLAKELKGLKEDGIPMWEVMSLVWVEMMCYAACNCTVSEHAAQLPKGGQLLTIVWLLVAHFGMTIRFQDLN